MRRSKLFTVLFLALVLSGLGLAWVIYQQLEASAPPSREIAAETEAPEIPPLPPLPEFAMAPLLEFSAVVDRPVFSQSRRPPAVEKTVAAPTVASSIELTLKGVIYSEGERIALFLPTAGGEVLRLSEGSSYQGWDLVEVAPSEVLFKRGEREESLELVFDTPPSVVPKRESRDRRRQRAENNNRSRSRREQEELDALEDEEEPEDD